MNDIADNSPLALLQHALAQQTERAELKRREEAASRAAAWDEKVKMFEQQRKNRPASSGLTVARANPISEPADPIIRTNRQILTNAFTEAGFIAYDIRDESGENGYKATVKLRTEIKRAWKEVDLKGKKEIIRSTDGSDSFSHVAFTTLTAAISYGQITLRVMQDDEEQKFMKTRVSFSESNWQEQLRENLHFIAYHLVPHLTRN